MAIDKALKLLDHAIEVDPTLVEFKRKLEAGVDLTRWINEFSSYMDDEMFTEGCLPPCVDAVLREVLDARDATRSGG